MTTLQRKPSRAAATMAAFVLPGYGSPDVLERTEVDRPVPGEGEVLVRVRASSVQPYDWHHLRGEPYVARLMPGTLGLRRPKLRILGADLAGQVEAVGPGVTGFAPGDEVYALRGRDCFAEYACVPARELAPKPQNLTFEQAAAVPLAALTAWLGLHDQGRVQPGQRVLVNGASGGVGTFAVQLARASGAEVTGVCSTGHLDLVRSIGAAEVIDYTTQDFTRTGQRYDLLLDIAGTRSAWACRRVLTRTGAQVVIGGPAGRWLQPVRHLLGAFVAAPFVSHRVAAAVLDRLGPDQRRQRLLALTELIEDGQVTPVIDRSYPFDQLVAAIRYQEQGHAAGKVVVTI